MNIHLVINSVLLIAATAICIFGSAQYLETRRDKPAFVKMIGDR